MRGGRAREKEREREREKERERDREIEIEREGGCIGGDRESRRVSRGNYVNKRSN